MKIFNKAFIFCLILLTGISFGQVASAAKTLSLSKDISVRNTGDVTARTATLDLTLDEANDVNGLVFTLVYDPAVFAFEGLFEGDMPIDDGAGYDPAYPPSADTIANTLYYQVNNKADKGIVMIAAAAANFFVTSPTEPFTAFKAKFTVVQGAGNGKYPINIQKTIIGPDTAANAGYSVPTLLAAAAGLAPDADPKTAQSYHDVTFSPGLIIVTGGYKVSGTAVYGSTPTENITNGIAYLVKSSAAGDVRSASQAIKDGKFSFDQVPNGTYKVEIESTRPGYQRRLVSAGFTVNEADMNMPEMSLAKYQSKSGSIMINGSNNNLSGLRVEVRDGDGKVIANVAVDASGNFVTPALPESVEIYAVYGNQAVDITNDLNNYDWTLSLNSISGTITGLCNDQMVEVLVRSETTKIQKSELITGELGTASDYTLSNLLPGTDYVLSVVGEGLAVFYDGVENFSDRTFVGVTADTATTDKDFAFTCGDLRTISGTVTVDDEPVSGVTVKANNYNFASWRFSSAVTNTSGVFEITAAPSADYYVYFNHNGSNYYYKAGAGENAVTSRSDATLVDVSDGPAPDIDLAVEIPIPDTARLEGYVTLNRSLDNGGTPVENYLVVLLTTGNVPTGFFSRTNKDGYYSFVNLPPGSYNVSLRPPSPYAAQINEGVALENDAATRSDFIVDQHFRVQGAVKESAVSTTPVEGASVDILRTGGIKLRAPVLTNTEGVYQLFDVPSGVYTLAASHPDYYPKEKTGVQVISNMTVDHILMTKGAIIDGIVHLKDVPTELIGNAVVTLAGPGYVKSTRTNALGEYEFRGLAANSPHMIMAAKGTEYKPFVPDDVDTGDVGTTTTYDMTLEIPVSHSKFAGKVQEDGSGVNQAYVMIYSQTTQYRKVARTNASGEFSFNRVIHGTDYSLLVLPGGGKPEILKSSITIDGDVEDYVVNVPTITTISGTITLSQADSTAIVIAGAYDPLTGVVHEVRAVNSGNNQTFTYTIKVKANTDYKVFAQDLTGGFGLRYYASDEPSTTGAYADATVVNKDTAGVNITLTK
jgi:hypothetical protein